MDFADLGLLPELLQAVSEQGYQTPSPIQAEAIPHVLDRRDVMAAAQTGTGKTASFTLPMLHHLATKASVNKSSRSNQVRSLILTPTRELAAQVADNVVAYSKHLNIKSVVIFGGVKINPQMMKLRGGADVLIATPGRLLDLYNQNALKFDQLETLVLDEADRMLDMGFLRDIKKILALLPKHRQTLLFSATFSDDIRTLAKGLVNDPIEVSVAPPNTTAKTVKQWISAVDKAQKPAALIQLIKTNQWQQVLVFTRTKHGANRLTEKLNKAGITAAAIHGNKSQAARTKALANFKSNEIRILVATDIAARGIDIEQLPQVVNFELPNTAEDYVHRIGRTGRAGEDGEAVSLVSADEFQQLKDIERLIKEVLTRVEIKGFNAGNALPESKLDTRPIKAKKPKKPKKPRQNHQDGQRSVGSHQAEKKQNKKPSSSNRTETGNKQEKTQSNQPSRSTPKKRPAKPSNRSTNDNPWGNR